MKKSITVAVTGFEASAHSQAATAICRCLRDSVSFEGRIIGLTYDPYTGASYEPGLLDAAHLVSSPQAGRGKFLAEVRKIKEKDGMDVLIIAHENEYPHILREEIEQLGIRTLLPDATAKGSLSRRNMIDLSKDLRIDMPTTYVAESLPMAWAQANTIGYPCFLKSTLDSRSFVTHSDEETTIVYQSFVAEGYQTVLVQGMLRGETITVHGLASQGGGWIGGAAVKKIAPAHSGSTWGGVTVDMPDLLQNVEKIVRYAGWTGPLEVDFLHEEDLNRCTLIDIRPGYGSMVSFLYPGGMNLPELGVRLALGENLCRTPSPIPGILTFRYTEDLLSDMSAFAAFSVTREVHHDGHNH